MLKEVRENSKFDGIEKKESLPLTLDLHCVVPVVTPSDI